MLVGSVDTFAARPPGAGGGGGGGRPTPEEGAQNLSVPGILVGGLLEPLVCGANPSDVPDLVPPTGTPLTGYEVDPTAYYWVQKVHTWQAPCFSDTGVEVYGAWGDNIEGGDASLTTGAPIRVEIVLYNRTDYAATIQGDPTPTLDGYDVGKLQPSLEDRVSAWGHLASGDATAGWTANPILVQQADWVVYDAGMQIEIYNTDTLADAVPLQLIAPEINASGKIVYGYNLRVTEAGTYTIHFNAPNVAFTGTDSPDERNDANNAYLDIVVTAKNTGGGGGGGKPNR
jgi:hypothetical protein